MQGVDYSSGRPNLAELNDLGKSFVGRYVGTPGFSKNLTRTEAVHIKANGMDIFSCVELTAGWMPNGSLARGAEIAKRAQDDARNCGMPEGRPIYLAMDVDPALLTSEQWLNVKDTLRGAAGVLGPSAVGVYGAFSVIEWAVPRYAALGWQTYAWSRGRLSEKAHLYQYKNGVTLAGAKVDLNKSLAVDFGQWGYKKTTPLQEVLVKATDLQFFVKNVDNGAVLLVFRNTGNPLNPVSSVGMSQPFTPPAGMDPWVVSSDDFGFFNQARVDTDEKQPYSVVAG